MRRWNSLMPQGGLARSGHALQTTYARTTTRTQTVKTGTMVSITLIYTNAQDAPHCPRHAQAAPPRTPRDPHNGPETGTVC